MAAWATAVRNRTATAADRADAWEITHARLQAEGRIAALPPFENEREAKLALLDALRTKTHQHGKCREGDALANVIKSMRRPGAVADINTMFTDPLHAALLSDNTQGGCLSAARIALQYQHADVLRFLCIDCGVDPNRRLAGNTLLHDACERVPSGATYEIVRLLVEELGANIHEPNNQLGHDRAHMTAIEIAMEANRPRLVHFLLRNGALQPPHVTEENFLQLVGRPLADATKFGRETRVAITEVQGLLDLLIGALMRHSGSRGCDDSGVSNSDDGAQRFRKYERDRCLNLGWVALINLTRQAIAGFTQFNPITNDKRNADIIGKVPGLFDFLIEQLQNFSKQGRRHVYVHGIGYMPALWVFVELVRGNPGNAARVKQTNGAMVALEMAFEQACRQAPRDSPCDVKSTTRALFDGAERKVLSKLLIRDRKFLLL